LAQDGLGELFH